MKYSAEDLEKEVEAIKHGLQELDSDLIGYRLNIKFEKINEEIVGNKRYYTVKMSIEGDKNELNQIERVEYKLHPSFTKDLITSNKRGSNFSRMIKIWGFFTVRATVYLQGGKTIKLARFINF